MNKLPRIIGSAVFAALLIFSIMSIVGCKSMTVASVDSITGPDKVRLGQKIDPNSITVMAWYEDGKLKRYTVSRSNIVFDENRVGRQTVRINVGRQTGSFETEVMPLTSLTVSSQPSTVTYKQGVEPDPTWPGLVIRGEWQDLGSDIIPFNLFTVSGFNSNQAGQQNILFEYLGQRASVTITFVSMSSIRVDPPKKEEYFQGEPFDYEGLAVYGTWEGFPEERLTITEENISGFRPNSVGKQTITVRVGNVFGQFSVLVYGLTMIEIAESPIKLQYFKTEPVDLKGIRAIGYYTAGDNSAPKQIEIALENLIVLNDDPNRSGSGLTLEVSVHGAPTAVFGNITISRSESLPPVPPPPFQGRPAWYGAWRNPANNTTISLSSTEYKVNSNEPSSIVTWKEEIRNPITDTNDQYNQVKFPWGCSITYINSEGDNLTYFFWLSADGNQLVRSGGESPRNIQLNNIYNKTVRVELPQ